MVKVDKVGTVGSMTKRVKYPFEDMEVGDSFFVETDEKGRHRLSESCQYHGKKNNKVFATRKELNGFRVWRSF